MSATATVDYAEINSICASDSALLNDVEVNDTPLQAENDYRSLSTNDLIKLCSGSSQHPAWSEFHRRFDRFVRVYVAKMLRRNYGYYVDSNNSFIELKLELTQEVYVKLLNDEQYALKRFNGDKEVTFLSYLSRIATNIVTEYFRKHQCEKRKSRSVSIETLFDQVSAKQSGSRELIFKYLSINPELEWTDRINTQQLLSLVDETLHGPNFHRNKAIFSLYLIEGYSIAQIIHKLNLPLQL